MIHIHINLLIKGYFTTNMSTVILVVCTFELKCVFYQNKTKSILFSSLRHTLVLVYADYCLEWKYFGDDCSGN